MRGARCRVAVSRHPRLADVPPKRKGPAQRPVPPPKARLAFRNNVTLRCRHRRGVLFNVLIEVDGAVNHRSFCVATILRPECPLWVRSGHSVRSRPCPLYPRKRTLELSRAMSALCQKQTSSWRSYCAIPAPHSPRPTASRTPVRRPLGPLFFVRLRKYGGHPIC
jgi:hypothetical protein